MASLKSVNAEKVGTWLTLDVIGMNIANKLTCFLVLLALTAGCTTRRITKDISISRPIFEALVTKPGTTNKVWTRTTIVPWSKYGLCRWELTVHTTRSNAAWHAYYQYPRPNDYLRTLGTNTSSEITDDFSATIDRNNALPHGGGKICGVWVIMPGEPPGDYSVIPCVDYVPVYVFRYQITKEHESVQQCDGD